MLFHSIKRYYHNFWPQFHFGSMYLYVCVCLSVYHIYRIQHTKDNNKISIKYEIWWKFCRTPLQITVVLSLSHLLLSLLPPAYVDVACCNNFYWSTIIIKWIDPWMTIMEEEADATAIATTAKQYEWMWIVVWEWRWKLLHHKRTLFCT